ncbi:MAG: ABC transporter ATP-binding protein [Fimbriimonadaceae bacterium]|nr:ABC transporter ATP-binding protein [Fimbriimonadaceae bacterium]
MVGGENLGKRYGDRWLFRRLDFTVAPGECLVLLGRNGSGKSTLLKLLAGLTPPTEGKVTRPDDVGSGLGYAALDQAVYPTLTVAEHLELAARLRGCTARVSELLDEVGLAYAAGYPARTLSTGMRARLKLALAVQAGPGALLLDEPGAGLDADGLATLSAVVAARAPRTAIVIATNDPAERRFATHELELA